MKESITAYTSKLPHGKLFVDCTSRQIKIDIKENRIRKRSDSYKKLLSLPCIIIIRCIILKKSKRVDPRVLKYFEYVGKFLKWREAIERELDALLSARYSHKFIES